MKPQVSWAIALLACVSACHRKESTSLDASAGAGDSRHGPPVIDVDPTMLTSGRIAIAPAERRAMRGDVRVPAEVVASETGSADVGALVTGRIGTIEVREGDSVKRGQVLAWVDSPEAARVAADVIRTRARVMAAARKVERQVGLEQENATSASAVDEARTDLATAQADAAAARTLLTSLNIPEPPAPSQSALATRVPVRTPIDGVVVERLLALGAPVTPEKTIFRILAQGSVLVEARWTDAAMALPSVNTPVKLLARGGDGKTWCTGKVSAIVARVDAQTRAQRVRITADPPCPMLVPGAFIDARFTSNTGSAGEHALAAGASLSIALPIALPKEAVVDIHGAPTVFVAQAKTGSFSPRAVTLEGTTTDDIAVTHGIKEGDLVVVVGAVLLKGELLRTELESP